MANLTVTEIRKIITERRLSDIPRGVDRSNPAFRVLLNNVDAATVNLTSYISKVEFVDDDEDAKTIEIKMANPGGSITDHPSLIEGATVSVWMGYVGALEFMGQFKLDQPEYEFAGDATISLKGKGDEADLADTEKTRSFASKTDSQIAQEIAQERGWEFEGDDTKVIHEEVQQTNQNDILFLQDRASLSGYQVFVDYVFRDGKTVPVLHFHALRSTLTDIELIWKDGAKSSLRRFSIKNPTKQEQAKTEVGGIDLGTGEDYLSESGDGTGRPNVKQGDGSSQMGDQDPYAFLDQNTKQWVPIPRTERKIGQQSSHTPEEAQGLADGAEGANRWSVKGEGLCVGLPQIRARKTVKLKGIGKWSGPWYVKKATHTVQHGYETRFECTTVGHNDEVTSPDDAVADKTKKEATPAEESRIFLDTRTKRWIDAPSGAEAR